MSPTILVLAFLFASLCSGFRVYNKTIVYDVNEHGMMDMVIEGGVKKGGATIGGTLVRGKYQSHNKTRSNGQRQATIVVVVYQNINEGGTPLALDDSQLVYNDLSDYSFSDE